MIMEYLRQPLSLQADVKHVIYTNRRHLGHSYFLTLRKAFKDWNHYFEISLSDEKTLA